MLDEYKKSPEASNIQEDFKDFLSLTEKHTKDVIEFHTRSYNLNKSSYSREPKVLTASQADVLIKLRNNGISSQVIANTLKIRVLAVTKTIKHLGYKWSVCLKKYVLKEELPKTIKKQLVEKTSLNKLKVDASIYRIIALKAYLDSKSYSQIISEAIIASTSKEIKDLANKPNKALKFDRLKNY
jgi:hypothetical protein